MRFTIRDILWLTVVVGLALSLYQYRTLVARQQLQINRQEKTLREQDFRYGRLGEEFAKLQVAMKRLEASKKASAKP
jgi:hypothetical protein